MGRVWPVGFVIVDGSMDNDRHSRVENSDYLLRREAPDPTLVGVFSVTRGFYTRLFQFQLA